MRLFLSFMLGGAVLAAGAQTAFAADTGKNFHGFYVGAEFGLSVESGLTEDLWYDANDSNFYYGGIMGYRHQFDNGLVLGLEAGLGDNTYNNKVRPIVCNDCSFLQAVGVDNNWVGDYKSNYSLSLSATAGFVFGKEDKNLLYVSSGYVTTNNATELPRDSEASDLFYKEDDTGWRLGAGFERVLHRNLSLRLSANYTDYGDYLAPVDNMHRFDGWINRRVNGAEQYQLRLALIANF